jgi:hypothetical protein
MNGPKKAKLLESVARIIGNSGIFIAIVNDTGEHTVTALKACRHLQRKTGKKKDSVIIFPNKFKI